MKPIKIEPIMTQLEDFFMTSSHDLVKAVTDERYEEACDIRDDIEDKVLQIYELLLKNELTKIDPELLLDLLIRRKDEYIKEWEILLEVPLERRLDI